MVKATSYHHPLDALSAGEIKACSRACAAYAEAKGLDNLRFNVVSLKVKVSHKSTRCDRDWGSTRSLAEPLLTACRSRQKLSSWHMRQTKLKCLLEQPTVSYKPFQSPQSMKYT